MLNTPKSPATEAPHRQPTQYVLSRSPRLPARNISTRKSRAWPDMRPMPASVPEELTAVAPDLFAELRAAHQIIRNALQIMTTSQKNEWGLANARDGVGGESTARANERQAVIDCAIGPYMQSGFQVTDGMWARKVAEPGINGTPGTIAPALNGAIEASNRAEALPMRMRALQRDDSGQPIPYLFTELCANPDGTLTDHAKHAACSAQLRCWLCGEKLGRYGAFMTEPLASVTRVSRTPPAHQDCAKYAALTGIMRPPESTVSLVWVTRSFTLQSTGTGHTFAIGNAEQAFWFANGRVATREEVRVAMQAGLPDLYAAAHQGGASAVSGLDLRVARATRQFPPYATVAPDHSAESRAYQANVVCRTLGR